LQIFGALTSVENDLCELARGHAKRLVAAVPALHCGIPPQSATSERCDRYSASIGINEKPSP
jgi:hypothetical protein